MLRLGHLAAHRGHNARSALLERNIISLQILQPIALRFDVLRLHEKHCPYQSSILKDFFFSQKILVDLVPFVRHANTLCASLFPAAQLFPQ